MADAQWPVHPSIHSTSIYSTTADKSYLEIGDAAQKNRKKKIPRKEGILLRE